MQLTQPHKIITGAMGLVTLIVNPTIGLITGIILYSANLASSWLAGRRRKGNQDTGNSYISDR